MNPDECFYYDAYPLEGANTGLVYGPDCDGSSSVPMVDAGWTEG